MSIIYRGHRGLIPVVTTAAEGADVVVVHPYDHALQAFGACTPCYGRPFGHWPSVPVSGPPR